MAGAKSAGGAGRYRADIGLCTAGIRLRDSLHSIQGKFVLSYNDCPEVRELYRGYHIDELERQHNLKPKERYHELLIKNW